MSKIKVSILNPTTLRLEEKGAIGDTINLGELQSVDNTLILEAIKNARDETYQMLLAKEIAQQEANKKIALNELENKLVKEHDNLKSEKQRLSLLVDSFAEKLKAAQESTKIALESNFAVEKSKLESTIEELRKSIENQKRIVVLEVEQKKNEIINQNKEEFRSEITKKELEIKSLEGQLKNKEALLKVEIEKEAALLGKSYGEQLAQKENEINQLKLTKSNLQVKMLGEELERWCNSEYEAYSLAGFDDCKWYKDNKAVKGAPDEKGTKADYIFEVYADNRKDSLEKLLSVCCEMKSESPETKSKTKNADHYKKLEDDRIKKNCQYALLISELEWDTTNDVPIKKIAEYENMYLVRPTYFISFLSLIKSLANKYQALLIEHKTADDNFKESQIILDEFESFKTTYLDKPLLSLLKDVEEIKNEADKAYRASYKIVGLADTIISNKISEIKVKIDRFDIRKIVRRIEKL